MQFIINLKIIFLFLIGVLFIHCDNKNIDLTRTTSLKSFYDPIDLPTESNSPVKNLFTDKGAWFGFSLPNSSNNSYGFIGPYLMQYKYGAWLSNSLIDIAPIRDTNSKDTKIESSETYFDAGKLFYKKQFENGINIDQSLFFISEKTVLINSSIYSEKSIESPFQWSGDFLIDYEKIEKNDNGFQITLKNKMVVQIQFSIPIDNIKITENGYKCNSGTPFEINEKPISIQILISVFTKNDDLKSEINKVNLIFNNLDNLIKGHEKRWTNYSESIFNIHKEDTSKNLDSQQSIAVKSLLTLINNWRSPYGELKNEGLFPSYARWYFRGFWAWDSWKHAVALAHFEPEVAKNQVRVMYDFQNAEGMIADCVFPDTTIENHNWRDTKPPLSAWAVWSIYNQTKDEKFLKEMYPKIVKYHEWWYKYRDHNSNGLCEYGSTDGTEIAARWESGMDNAVRFDDIKMIQNHENAWSMDQESVDLNSYLYAEKIFLKNIANILGYETDADKFLDEAENLKNLIQKLMFDSSDGYFYDIKLNDGTFVKVKGPEGWIPLWANVATQSQAEAVVDKILDSQIFNTKIPFPTLDASHLKFNPEKGYWRGPVWMDQAYFALMGMKKYGFDNEATNLTTKIFNEIQYPALYENYHPTNGTGLNSPHFSWTAAHLYLMYKEILN